MWTHLGFDRDGTRRGGPNDLPDEHFDLLVSLYAGFISEQCTRHLKVGGTLLVNPSRGDAGHGRNAQAVLSGPMDKR